MTPHDLLVALLTLCSITCLVSGGMWWREHRSEQEMKKRIAERIARCRDPYATEDEITADVVLEGFDKRDGR